MNTKPENFLLKKDLSDFLQIILEEEKLKFKVNIEVINAQRGTSKRRYDFYRITIPSWAKKYGLNYCLAYLIHELNHCIVGYNHNHDKIFKKHEKKLLKKYLNAYEFIYHNRTYLKEVKTMNGQTLFKLPDQF